MSERTRETPYDHPDAQLLTGLVQELYVGIFGRADANPIDPAHFVLPDGYFVVAYDSEVPVSMGGWRRHAGHDAEIRRMFVRDGYRGRGFARAVLTALEQSARGHGIERLILETSVLQPEAVALYRSSGYLDIPAFGYYSGDGRSVHLGKHIGE